MISKTKIFNEILQEYNKDSPSFDNNIEETLSFQNLTWVDTSFLYNNNFYYLKFMFFKSFWKSYLDMLLQEIQEEDLWQEIYLLCLKKLLKFDWTKWLTAHNYIIFFFNTKLRYHLNKIIYNKQWITFYKYTELDSQNKNQDLKHAYISSYEENPEYFDTEYNSYDSPDIKSQEDLYKEAISNYIHSIIPKYWEKIIDKFQQYFYWNIKPSDLSNRHKNLFNQISEEIKSHISNLKY